MSRKRPLGIAVVGTGFMGSVHIDAIHALEAGGVPCRLAAVCDRNEDRLTGERRRLGNLEVSGDRRLFDPARVMTSTSLAEILAEESVDAVSVCTRTDTHVDIAIQCLDAGKHVLVEKPVARTAAEVAALVNHPRGDQVLMPAMCMRFWPGWTWLKIAVDERRHGDLVAASFRRLGSVPGWSREFYGDASLSGGAWLDLHVHDVDFVRHLLGTPDAVSARGDLHHIEARFDYPSVRHGVRLDASWKMAPGMPFRMQFTAVFENATADFDLGREPELQVASDGRLETIALPNRNGYEAELEHFVALATDAHLPPVVTIEDALEVSRLLERELEQLDSSPP